MTGSLISSHLVGLNIGNDSLVPLGDKFNTLQAVKSANSLLLEAFFGIECLDEALACVDGAILLANFFSILGNSWNVVVLGLNLN